MAPSNHQELLSSSWIKHFRLIFRKDRRVLTQGKLPLPSVAGSENHNEKEQVDVSAFVLPLLSLVFLIAAGGRYGKVYMGGVG